jgi:hypothetical protein
VLKYWASKGRGETMSPIEPSDILTPKQLAKRLQVPVSWVYKHTDNSRSNGNRLPVLRCDGFLRFSWPDVCEWLRATRGARQ